MQSSDIYLTSRPSCRILNGTPRLSTPGKQTHVDEIHINRPSATTKMSFDSPLPPYNASDPTATFLNSSCLDLLMIELVPMAYRVVNEVDAAASSSDFPIRPQNENDTSSTKASSKIGSERAGHADPHAVKNVNGGGRKMDEDEERDAVFFRLEMLGYRVGQGLVERFVFPPCLKYHNQSTIQEGVS